MYIHCGTHIDTMNHFGYRREIDNHFKTHEHVGRPHQGCVRRGVAPVGDRSWRSPRRCGAPLRRRAARQSRGIGPKDIEGCLRHQRIALQPGDVVLLRTGRIHAWPDPVRYMSNPPRLTRDGASYVAHAGAIMIGSDTNTP
jgi:kynurenine formamidase